MYSLLLTLFLFSNPDAEYMPYHQLQWSDFKASKPIGKDAIAETSAHLIMTTEEVDGKATYKVFMVFVPDESFTATDRPDILRHEQTHVNIFQLYSLKCAQSITKYQGK